MRNPALTAGFLILAGATGIEPATSGVTGRRSNRLNYAPSFFHPSFIISKILYKNQTLQPSRESISGRSNRLNYAPNFKNPKS